MSAIFKQFGDVHPAAQEVNPGPDAKGLRLGFELCAQAAVAGKHQVCIGYLRQRPQKVGMIFLRLQTGDVQEDAVAIVNSHGRIEIREWPARKSAHQFRWE